MDSAFGKDNYIRTQEHIKEYETVSFFSRLTYVTVGSKEEDVSHKQNMKQKQENAKQMSRWGGENLTTRIKTKLEPKLFPEKKHG